MSNVSGADEGSADGGRGGDLRPVLVYDGDCGICMRLVGLAGRLLRPDVRLRAAQQLDLAAYGLTAQQCDEALQFVAADGWVYSAQKAVAQLLLHSGRPWRPAGLVMQIPGMDQVAGVVYRWVARNRYRLPGGTPACAVEPRPPGPGRPEAASTGR